MSDSEMNHRLEAALWETAGEKVREAIARAAWTSLTEDFDRRGLVWRT